MSSSIQVCSAGGWIDDGVPVSLGSDCPAFFGVDLLDEYMMAYRDMGLGKQEIIDIAWNSLTHSAVPRRLLAEVRSRIGDWSEQSAAS